MNGMKKLTQIVAVVGVSCLLIVVLSGVGLVLGPVEAGIVAVVALGLVLAVVWRDSTS